MSDQKRHATSFRAAAIAKAIDFSRQSNRDLFTVYETREGFDVVRGIRQEPSSPKPVWSSRDHWQAQDMINEAEAVEHSRIPFGGV